jgi:two-component system phosphate regulon sensor histidine kinase PhoR
VRVGIRLKLFSLSLLLILLVIAVSGEVVQVRLTSWLDQRLERELVVQARLASGIVSRLPAPLDVVRADSTADALAGLVDARVTLILADGTVIGDSDLDLAGIRTIENHRERPEFRQALETGIGVSRRYSATVGVRMLYVAVPLQRPDRPGMVRLSLPLTEILLLRHRLRGFLLLAGLIGVTLAILLSGMAAELVSRTLRRVAETSQAIARGGTRRRIAAYTSDEIGGLAGSVNEIADQLEQTVEMLARERNRFEAVLESMSEAVLALDPELHVTLVNAEALKLLGLVEASIGRSLVETIRAPAVQGLVGRALAGEPGSGEFDLGADRPVRVLARATPLRITGGVVLVLHDVTELRRLETVRRDFVANVSHELRTPVSIIRANAETLIDSAADDPVRSHRFLDAILRNAERLSELVVDLLDISRIEAGEYRPHPSPVAVGTAVRRAVGSVGPAAEAREQSVRVRMEGEPVALADVQALDQVLLNLLENAVRYAPPQSHIEVRVESGSVLRIEVADDGPGIDPRHRERIFERFYRVDEGRSRERGGTGLGLSIVKHLTEAMGGRVGYLPASPHGSIFWITLPVPGDGEPV